MTLCEGAGNVALTYGPGLLRLAKQCPCISLACGSLAPVFYSIKAIKTGTKERPENEAICTNVSRFALGVTAGPILIRADRRNYIGRTCHTRRHVLPYEMSSLVPTPRAPQNGQG